VIADIPNLLSQGFGGRKLLAGGSAKAAPATRQGIITLARQHKSRRQNPAVQNISLGKHAGTAHDIIINRPNAYCGVCQTVTASPAKPNKR